MYEVVIDKKSLIWYAKICMQVLNLGDLTCEKENFNFNTRV
ncbi:hypothetical protein EFM7_1279 [Enterococcus faecalis M7]|nr:hypothetical protein EFM7_1279 [Enterococcus faecalis M7]